MVTGNVDRAHDVCSTILFSLIHLGCTVSPNADCYWIGDAGSGPSYMKQVEINIYLQIGRSDKWLITIHISQSYLKKPDYTYLKKLEKEVRGVIGVSKQD